MVHYKSISQTDTNLADREKAWADSWYNGEELGPHILLQTCNRIEYYYGDDDVPQEVARHLFRVTSGLESAIIGERAIQGQVREAYMAASKKYLLTSSLHRLFQMALSVGKQVRENTKISRGAVTHSLAALELAEMEGIDLTGARICIIGVNQLTTDTLAFLKNKGAETIFLANRSREKAEQLIQDTFGNTFVNCQVYDLKQKREFLAEADVVISATSAPHSIIGIEDLTPGHPLLMIDLAFPRDIDPVVAELPNVKLFNLEDVERQTQHNREIRIEAIQDAEKIIERKILELEEALKRRSLHKEKQTQNP